MITREHMKVVMAVKNIMATQVLRRTFMLAFLMCGSRGLKDSIYFSTKSPKKSSEIFFKAEYIIKYYTFDIKYSEKVTKSRKRVYGRQNGKLLVIQFTSSTLQPHKHHRHDLGMLSSDPDPVHHENDPAGQGFAVSKLGLQLTAEPPVNYNRP